MNKALFFCISLVLYGCKNTTISEENLSYLNGYWEIVEVEFPDGTKKSYTVNPSIDFINLENDQGFRKKVQPKFDGTYQISNDAESFELIKMNDLFILRYKNQLSEWEEKLIQLDSVSFSVRNEEDILYSYKRFQPFSISK